MGNIDLRLGDCLDVMAGMEDECVDMVLTDPPYGMSYQSNRRVVKDRFDKINNDDGLDWLDVFVGEAFRVLRQNTAFYCFCSWHNVDAFKSAIEKKFKIKNLIVWVKNNHGSGDLKAGYAPKHELVIYANKGRCLNRGKRHPDVINFSKISSAKLLHPTEKPVDMLEFFVSQSSDSGDIVLDPFMGSGSAGVACKSTGRDFIGVEMEETYYSVAMARLND